MNSQVPVLRQSFAIPLRFHRRCRLNCFFEAPIFIDQVRRPFFTDSGYSGYVVGGISDNRQYIHYLFRIDPKIFFYSFTVDKIESTVLVIRFYHSYMVLYELHKILIRCNQVYIYIFLLRPVSQSPYNIIRFIAVLFQILDSEIFNHLLDQRDTYLKIFRLRRPVRFVLLIHIMAECRFGSIPYHCDMCRFLFIQKLYQCVGKPQNRTCRNTCRVL